MLKPIKLAIFSAHLIILFITAFTASSQEYELVYPGSKYLCGRWPDGTNKIYNSGGSNLDPVQVKSAVKSVNRDISKIQGRIERLNEIKSSLNDGKLSPGEIGGFNSIMNAADPGRGPLPPGKNERRDALNALISKLKIDIKNRKGEIKALKDCDDDKRPEQYASFIDEQFVKYEAEDGIYISLILYVPVVLNPDGKPYPQRWMCVQGANDPQGSPRLFTGNPCYQGVPAFSGNSCPVFNRKGYLAVFFAHRIFKGVLPGLEDPIVIQAEAEFREKFAGGVRSRPRKSLADNCQAI